MYLFDNHGDVVMGAYHNVDKQSNNVKVGVANLLALYATIYD
jgi:hypothetical protein